MLFINELEYLLGLFYQKDANEPIIRDNFEGERLDYGIWEK
jgi:hypothetical protein